VSLPVPYPIPENEAARLQALRECAILDTAPEPEYDDLVALAASICATPLAAISLIDDARQWFKARVGIDARETSRELSFCAHTICQPGGEPLVVDDASADERFATYANVACAEGLRFYAGVPLVTQDGAAIGSLCVADLRPRRMGDKELVALRTLGRHLINALELRRLVRRQAVTIADLERTRRALDEARMAAERATEAKSRFLASMSHEIRTPLNAILGMTTLLADLPLEGEARECSDTIRSSGEILLGLVNDILDLSKIESGRLVLDPAPFDPADIVRRSADCLRGAARAKDLSLELRIAPEIPARVVGDSVRLRQILVNLLANAIKFTARGGVVVEASLAPASDSGAPVLAFAVSDTGIGIAPDRVVNLFNDYAQAEASTARHYGGTGLGLAISKRLAEAHGGRIWVESTPGQGSTFRFTFAVRPSPAGADEAPPAVAPALDRGFAAAHPLEVLVADDNPVNLRVAGLLLERLGYRPAFARDGEDALRQLHARRFDLLLLDIEMPVLDGVATAARVREEFAEASRPRVVALTGHAVADERRRLAVAGMDDHLCKPLRVEQLVAQLRLTPRRA
jgi:signal transduction histidine kinase/CheY-like chemotaxis protein